MRERGSWFRSFVLWFIDSWVEGVSLLLFIGLIYASWQLMKDEFTRGWGIGLLCIGTLVLFLISWIFFCIIETRDLLKSIEENTRGGIVNTSTKTPPAPTQIKEVEPIPADDEKFCPHCNAIIKKTAKKCRFCNNWLDENNGGNE